MADGDSRGPRVPPEETLYRFVTVPSFWVCRENRPSSSLFDDPPCVSVNVASMTTIQECRHQLREDLGMPDGGMVSFNCGEARDLGFDARHEPSPRTRHTRICTATSDYPPDSARGTPSGSLGHVAS